MEELSESEVRSRIARARDLLRDKPPFALAFDGDGTLWSGDVGEDYFHALLELGDLRPSAVEAMRQVARTSGLDERLDHDTGVAVARGLFQGYLEQRVGEELICEVIAWAAAGWRESDVQRFAREVVARGGMEARRRPALLALVDWARREQLELFLVSASPRPIVEAAGAAFGFDAAHVLAATARFGAGGVMLPEVVLPIPYGVGKATLLDRVFAASGERTLLAAFGDNIFDVPMLRASQVPVVVEPKPRLVEHLARLAPAEDGFLAAPVRLRVP